MSHNAELKIAAEGAVNAGSHWGRRDSFERQLAKLATPEAVLALIAENEQLAKTADCWDRLNVYNKALSDSFRAERDQSEQDYKDVVGTIELRDIEIAKLRAEVAGLRTGYEAYERVNAELKAEVEAFRGLLGEMRAIGNHAPAELTLRIDAAMGKGEQS